MDRRGSDEARREGATEGFWFTPGNPDGKALAVSGHRRSFRLVSRPCAPQTRGVGMRLAVANSAAAGAFVDLSSEHRTGKAARLNVRASSARRRGVTSRIEGRIPLFEWLSDGRIHIDPLICRYWELGMKPNSTPVHLWIFEQKSAIPRNLVGSFAKSGVSRRTENGHGNGERARGGLWWRRTSGRPHGTAAKTAVEGGAGWRFRGSSAPRDRARSTRSNGSSGRRRSRMSAGAPSSSRSTARSRGTGANWPRTWWPASTFTATWPAATAVRREGKREYSVRQLIDRVTRTIADWGKADGYFATAEDAARFYDELTSLCVNQYGSFNSPVWFNVGLFHHYGISGPANNWRWDEETRGVVKANSAYQYPAGVGLLHPERQRRHGRDHAAGQAARPCSSSSARAPAPISRPCVRATKSSPAAASRRGR